MIIRDSQNHCKWFERRRWWSMTKIYTGFSKYGESYNRNHWVRIFNDIKRNNNFSVTK